MKNIDKDRKISLAREALSYLLLIRHIKDQWGFRALIDSETFKNEVIKKAEECGSEAIKGIISKLTKLEYSKLHVFLDSDECNEEIVRPLKKFLKENRRWNENDEKEIKEIAAKLKAHIQMGAPLPQKEWKRANRFLAVAITFSIKAKDFIAGLKKALKKFNRIKKAENK